MKTLELVEFFVLLFSFFSLTVCQTTDETPSNDTIKLREDWSYCFEFTWFGPSYDNDTMYNGTCADYLDNTRAVDVPCSPPIVISFDGTPPDIDYLFKYHTNSVLCKRSTNQVCASYTYKFNGIVNNATYMCTKVQEVGVGPITSSGCYTQERDGYEIELCVCKSGTGVYKPCNGAMLTMFQSWVLLVILFVLIV